MKTFSFFEIEEGFESKLIQSFKGKRLSGISLEIEKDKESGKRRDRHNQKRRRGNRQKNNRLKKNSRNRRR